MGYYAGLDVSLEMTLVCIVDAAGKVVSEPKVASEPDAVIRYLADAGLEIERVGLEAGARPEWLAGALMEVGFLVTCMETR